VRLERIVPGRRPPDALVGGVLTRDLVVGGSRWSKGRRLSAADLGALGSNSLPVADPVTVLVLEPGDMHEDEAALALAEAAAGAGVTTRGPAQSRVDLVASVDGVLHIRTADLQRVNRVDPLEIFTAFDGSIVQAGTIVASIKIAPHVVNEEVVRVVVKRLRGLPGGLVRVAAFRPMRVAAVVKESLRAADRDRFERSVRDKVESLGSSVTEIAYVVDDQAAVTEALARAAKGPSAADIVLTAGGRSTDPLDPFYVAIDRLGGEVVRHGVPAHPGSMLWLARIGRTAVLGLPTCGAYSKATAADLVLPRLLTGERAGRGLVAGLGHGGLLTRDQRFRFPPYARTLDAPDG
jgi:hypothetical protein